MNSLDHRLKVLQESSRGLLCDCTTGCGTDGSFYSTSQVTEVTQPADGLSVMDSVDTEVIKSGQRYCDITYVIHLPQVAKSGEIVETLGSTQVMQEKFPVAGL